MKSGLYSMSPNGISAKQVCKVVHLYGDKCFNLIRVWGIQICRDTSSPSPLVATIGILKIAADISGAPGLTTKMRSQKSALAEARQ